LAVHRLNEISGREGFPHVFGIFQEGEIVWSFFAEFANPARISLGEAIAEFFELPVADFDIQEDLIARQRC